MLLRELFEFDFEYGYNPFEHSDYELIDVRFYSDFCGETIMIDDVSSEQQAKDLLERRLKIGLAKAVMLGIKLS